MVAFLRKLWAWLMSAPTHLISRVSKARVFNAPRVLPADPEPPPPDPGDDTLLASVTLENFNGSGASNLTREFGHVFKDGDIPAGSKLVITDSSDVDVTYALRDISYYASGAYKNCFIQIKDSTISASGSRTYKLKARSGGAYSNSPRSTTLSDVITALGSDLPSVEFSSITAKYKRVIQALGSTQLVEFDDFIGTGYSVTLIEASDIPMTSPADYSFVNGSGTTFEGTTGYDGVTVDLTADGNGRYIEMELAWTHAGGSASTDLTDANVADRIDTPISTALMKRFYTWSMATSVHLKVYWEVDVWFDGSGNIETVYVTAIPSLDWFDVAGKTTLSYTAVFKKGSSTLATYSSNNHAYHCQWATVRTDDNNWAGRDYCFLGSAESINPVYDRAYWAAAECFPLWHTTFEPDPLGSIKVYTALDDMSHRGDVDGTGEYAGRSPYSTFDVNAIMLQTADAWRISIVNALCALHFHGHTRPGDAGTDEKSRPLTLILDKPSAPADPDEYVADGMRTSVYFNRDGRNDGSVANDFAFPRQPTDGAFISGTGDASHAVDYGGFQWLVRGKEYLRQSLFDLMVHVAGQVPFDQYGSHPRTAFYERPSWQTAFSIANRQWASIPQVGGSVQNRSVGFSLNRLKNFGYVSPDRPEYNWAQDFIAHVGDYLGDSLAAMPSDFLALGLWPPYNAPTVDEFVHLMFHQVYTAMGVEVCAAATENAGIVALADHMARGMKNLLDGNPMKAGSYYAPMYHKTTTYDASTNPFPDPDEIGLFIDATFVTATNVFTTTRLFGGDSQPILRFSNGDKITPSSFTAFFQSAENTPVSPLVIGTTYYVGDISIGSSTITFKIYSDSGLTSEVNITGSNGTQRFILIPAGGLDDAYLDGNGNGLFPGDYAVTAVWAAVQANKRNPSIMTNTVTDNSLDYLALVDFDGDARWKTERL